MLKFICWKWKCKDKSLGERVPYTHIHVNILFNMLKRHIKIPFELFCITDDETNINVDIKIISINKYFNDFKQYGMCWRRLKAFSPEMKKIIGKKFTSIDLDCVILKDITSLFNNKNDFMIWEKENMYCGSLWMMKSGKRKEIWENFSKKDLFQCINNRKHYGKWLHKGAYSRGFKFTSDQSYISYMLYPNEKSWTKKDGIYNFDTQIYNKNVNMDDVKIVFFNGKRDPSMTNLQIKYPWIKQNWR